MSASTLPNATLTATYESMTPGSAALATKARGLMPSGLSHDSRHFDPYPLYMQRALGPVKWDVDGNKYVDYFGGHGALILGHNHFHWQSGPRRRHRSLSRAYGRSTNLGRVSSGWTSAEVAGTAPYKLSFVISFLQDR